MWDVGDVDSRTTVAQAEEEDGRSVEPETFGWGDWLLVYHLFGHIRPCCLWRSFGHASFDQFKLFLEGYVNFCLMKNARRWDSCHAQVMAKTVSCIRVHRTILPLVLSLWSRNSASRSCGPRTGVSVSCCVKVGVMVWVCLDMVLLLLFLLLHLQVASRADWWIK